MKPEKRKAALAIILGGMKPKPEESAEGDSAEESPDMGLETAMSEFIDAVHAKDAKGAAAAFKSAMELCESSPHAESDYSDDDEEDDDE